MIEEEHRNFEKDWVGMEKRLSALFYRRGCPCEDIKDLLQETVRRAWEKRLNRRGDFDPWVYGIARNVLREYLDKITHSDFSSDSPLPKYSHNELNDQSLVKIMIHQSLNDLDETGRKCLILYFLEGNTLEKTAEILEISVSNTHYHVEKACKELRERFSRGSLRAKGKMV